MDTGEAKSYLDTFLNFEKNLNSIDPIQFKLKRVEHLLERLGSPHQKLNIIHVAGTNGKGSVCAYTASILSSAGYKVGLYTSPHLARLNERIRVLCPDETFADEFCGSITDAELDNILAEVRDVIEEVRATNEHGRLTFFEVLTALALYYFYRKRTDFVVLETGLGGRLDATNVCPTKAAVVTHIGVEHKKFLGETLTQIASEKAAIIKDSRQSVILAPQETEAGDVLLRRCRAYDIRPYIIGEDIRYRSLSHSLKGQDIEIESRLFGIIRASIKILGDYQALNAATAVGVVEKMTDYLPLVGAPGIRKGLERTRWPGRMEVLQENPLVIVDGAHNPSSVKVLKETVQKIFNGQKVVLVLGVSNDKDLAAMAGDLQDVAHELIVTQAEHPRALGVDDPAWDRLFFHKAVVKKASLKEAFEQARISAGPDGIILVAGSLFLVGEARKTCISIKV